MNHIGALKQVANLQNHEISTDEGSVTNPEIYQASDIIYRIAQAKDDAKLKALLRENDMDSWVQMTLEREPSFFKGENLWGNSMAVIAYQYKPPYATIGMYSYALMPVHLNGKAVSLGYLGGLRVNPEYRYRIRLLKHGYNSIKSFTSHYDTSPFLFTSIASENQVARRLLEAGLKGMPIYQPLGELESLGISTKRGKLSQSGQLLQQATTKDIPALVAFYNQQASQYQFSPVLSEQWLYALDGEKGLTLEDFWLLKEGQNIVGCMAIWDQRAFKQTVSRGYRFPINILRVPYNIYAQVTKGLPLPKVGETLEQAYLAFMAFGKLSDAIILEAISEGITKVREKQANTAVIGLSSTNPLCGIVKKRFRAYVYRTCIEIVHWQDVPKPNLDSRAPQPEVAIL